MRPDLEFDRAGPVIPLLLASLAIAAEAALGPGSAQSERFVAMDHPAAVLAWAKLRCDPALELSRRGRRVEIEDLRNVVAAFDAASRYRRLEDLCAEAKSSVIVIAATRSRP